MTIRKEYVKDATKKLQITITNRDINASRRRVPEACAAAKCLMRMEGIDEAIVYKTRTLIRRKAIWTRYVTPISLQMELVAFDRGGRMEPGEHFLLPVPVNKRPTGRRQGSNKDKRTGNGNQRSYHKIEAIRRDGRSS